MRRMADAKIVPDYFRIFTRALCVCQLSELARMGVTSFYVDHIACDKVGFQIVRVNMCDLNFQTF